MTGLPRNAKGKLLDYKGTDYEQAIKDGLFDDGMCALLKKEKGKWKVVAWALGSTDVPWDGWDKEFKAPRALFPYGSKAQ
jgi:hypothetical protein